MTKRMLIDAAHPEETRVVIVDGTRIEEFDFESQARKQLRGNIYLAKVTRVEPSLQAAFVEYGGGRHGFLAFNEIHPDYYHIPLADKEALLREEAEEEEQFHASNKGAAAPKARGEDGEIEDDEIGDDDDDVMEEELERRRRRLMRRYKIQEVIKRRQIMLVQVVKEERGNKGAALTTYLSLAGRYCVLMPNTARGGGISRKIVSATDRKRLKAVVQSLDTPQGMGLIVRTAGAKRTKAEIKRDYEYLLRLWENIREVTLNSIAPALIYEEEDLVKRAIRDMYDKDLEGIEVEGEQGYRDAKEFMRMLMPSQAKKITAHRDPTPLFIKAKIEDHLSQIYSPVVPLRSGGYLVINQTEALVAIDVNSGKSTRERNVEATALKTNMEAAEEAARQLRLRDLAGLVVIDFIDMDEAKNNRAVEKKLKDSLKDDRARIQMGRISSFGLMELSRQRRRSGVLEGTTHVCAHCQGSGRVRATESSALSALRAVEIEAVRNGPGAVTLRAPRAVALYILNEKRAYLLRLHAAQGLHVTVQVDEALAHADHEIDRISSLSPEESRAFAEANSRLSQPAAYEADDADDILDDEEEDEEEAEILAEEREDEDDDVTSRSPYAGAEGAADEAREGGERGRGRRRRRRGGRRDEGGEPARPAVAAEPAPSGGGDDDFETDSAGHRRRRRGRRGGRRMREESRPNEVYAWSRVRVPHIDGVYGWFDPATAIAAPAAPPAQAASSSPQAYEWTAQPAPAALAAEPAVTDALEIWVELPQAEPAAARPGRARRSRSRRPGAGEAAMEAVGETPALVLEVEPVAEAPPVVEPEPVIEPAPAVEAPAPKPARKPRVSKAAAAKAAARAAEPVAEPVAEPPLAATAIVDAAEISEPAAQPRRGWWRRGA